MDFRFSAVIDEYNEEINSIPPKEKLMQTISFSPEFELKMKKLFAYDMRYAKGFSEKSLKL